MKKTLIFITILSFVFQGCASYHVARLPYRDISSFANAEDRGGLKVGIQALDLKESRKLFGVKKFYRLYQGVYIFINNETSATYEFKKEALNQPYLPAEKVAEVCSFSTGWRAGTYGVLGLFFLPLLVPAAVDGVGSTQANQRMEEDYAQKEIKDQKIAPGKTAFGVLYLDRKKMEKELIIKLRNVATNKEESYRFELQTL